MDDLIADLAGQLAAVPDKGDMTKNADRQVLPRFYPVPLVDAVIATRERIEEWDYKTDPHGYCHDRPDLVALVEEIERLRPDIAQAVHASRSDTP